VRPYNRNKGFVALQEKLIKFILATQDEETGGISDRPGDMVCNNAYCC